MKNITLSADEHLIEIARAQARARHTTLNAEFRRWLEEYTLHKQQIRKFDQTLARIRKYARTEGRKFTRDEMNER